MFLFRLQRLGMIALGAVIVALRTAAADVPMPRQPGDGDACPVCGMGVAPHREWIAQVIFDDDSAAFFDGCRDLFTYLLARDRFLPERRALEIAAIYVTAYYDLQPSVAADAWYVLGSDIAGPMGPELVPHRTLPEAEEFLRDHHGRQIVRFDEVTVSLLRSLAARPGQVPGDGRKG